MKASQLWPTKSGLHLFTLLLSVLIHAHTKPLSRLKADQGDVEKGPKGTKNIENKILERLKITKGDSGALWV
jgi:hypothetical protein